MDETQNIWTESFYLRIQKDLETRNSLFANCSTLSYKQGNRKVGGEDWKGTKAISKAAKFGKFSIVFSRHQY